MGAYCFECMSEVQGNLSECPHCNARIPYSSTDVRDCPAGTVLRNQYLIGKALGRGGFGVSYIALDLTNHRRVCIKECNVLNHTFRDPYNRATILASDDDESPEIFEKAKASLLQERDALVKLRGIPEVVQCYDGFECNNTTYLVMELLEGRDLKRYIRPGKGTTRALSINDAVYYTILLLNALSKVHEKGILHRDISPDNIFLQNDGSIKLIDFGSARKRSASTMTGFAKGGYSAPEIYAGEKEGPYTDIYSAGVVLSYLLTGKQPEKGSGLAPLPADCSTPELADIYNKAVHHLPKERYQSAAEMALELNTFLQKQSGQPVRGPKRLGLLIGLLAGMVALLMAIILFASSSTEPPVAPTATPTATATPTYSATATPTQATPSPTVHITPVPTAVLTHKLTTRPANAYALLAGTSVDIQLAYNEKGPFALDFQYDRSAVQADLLSPELLRLTALQAGEHTVTYFDGNEQRSFLVSVLAEPDVHMVTAETDNRVFLSERDGYVLFLPKGDTAQLEVAGLTGYTLHSDIPAASCASLAFEQGTHNQVITVNALEEGEQIVTVSTGNLGLFNITVTVTPHAVISDLNDEYLLYQNTTLPLDVVFSDNAAINPEQDVLCFSDCLRAAPDAQMPNRVILTAAKPGVADVIVGGRMFRVTVLALPSLEGETLVSNRSGDSYTLDLLENTHAQLALTNFSTSLPISVTAQNDNAPAVSLTQGTVEIDVNNHVGSYLYQFSSGNQVLFSLQLNVNAHSLDNRFKDTYKLMEGSSLSIPLLFRDSQIFAPEISTSNAKIVTAEYVSQNLVLHTHSHGNATITIDGNTFTVQVLPPLSLSAFSSVNLRRNGNAYQLTLGDTESATITLNNHSTKYSYAYEYVGDEACSIDITNQQLIVTAQREGVSTYTFYSDGLDSVAELFTLQVKVEFKQQITSDFQNRYTMLAGTTLELPLSFRNNQRFIPTVTSSNKQITATATEESITLIASSAAASTISVEGKSFKVDVLPRTLPSHKDLIREQDGTYSLYVRQGAQQTVSFSSPNPGYAIEVVASSQGKQLYKLFDTSSVRFSGSSSGRFSFDFYASNEHFREKLFTINLIISKPRLSTVFDFSYTMMEGDLSYLNLSFENGTPTMDVSCETMNAYVKNSKLYLDASSAGLHTVAVKAGDDTQTFYVQVNKPSVTFLVDGVPLQQSEKGVFQLTTHANAQVAIEVQTANIDGTLSVSISGNGIESYNFSAGTPNGKLELTTCETDKPTTLTLSCKPKNIGSLRTTRSRIPLAKLELTVGMEWRVSSEGLETLNDDPHQIILSICQSLKSLELLKGNAELQADRAIEPNGNIRQEIWQLMQRVKSEYSGFSKESYYTQDDYLRLLSIAAEYTSFQQAQATTAPASSLKTQNVEKDRFYIVDAAANSSSLYLLDEDGYVIRYDRNLNKLHQIYGNAKKRYSEIAGDGSSTLLVTTNGTYEFSGTLPEAMQLELENAADQVSSVALAKNSVLLVLAQEGIFALDGDKSLDPKQEGLYLSSGQAFYAWINGKTTKVMGASVGRENVSAQDITLTAAGDETIAFLGKNNNGGRSIYIKSTARNSGLSKKLGTINQNNRVFTEVKITLPNKQQLDPISLSVSDDNLAIVQKDGSVFVAGSNDRYQCGTGTIKEQKNFQQVMVRENRPLGNIIQVLSMDGYTLMVDNDGYIWICGNSGVIYTYATRMRDVSDVAKLIRLTSTQALAINYNGQVLILDYDQPLNYDPTFTSVQR